MPPRDRFVMEVDGNRCQPTIYLINNARVTKEEFEARWSGFNLNQWGVDLAPDITVLPPPKVWVQALKPLPTFEVLLEEPPDRVLFHKREAEIRDSSGMVLVDREELRRAVVQRGERGNDCCSWVGCEYLNRDDGLSFTPPDLVVPPDQRSSEPGRGPWYLSSRGRQLYPFTLRPEDIDVEDIAHSLAMLCRFNGHCRTFYSVAQHSVLVSRQLPAELALAGLLHDATEAYCGDMVRPIKKALPEYERLEDRIWEAVAARFGLPVALPAEVKIVDTRMLQTERRDLLAAHIWPWFSDTGDPSSQPYDFRIVPADPVEARAQFLARFRELTGERVLAEETAGAELVKVDLAELQEALIDSSPYTTERDKLTCRWPGCGYQQIENLSPQDFPHSGTCPLRGEP